MSLPHRMPPSLHGPGLASSPARVARCNRGEAIMTRMLGIMVVLVILVQPFAYAQSSPLQFKQSRDGAPAQLLSAAEMASLGDPLFNLVLKEHANLVKLM